MCCAQPFSPVWLFATPWTVAHQAPLPMEFSRQEYWSRLPFSYSRGLPDSGIKPASLTAPALAAGLLTTTTTWEAHIAVYWDWNNDTSKICRIEEHKLQKNVYTLMSYISGYQHLFEKFLYLQVFQQRKFFRCYGMWPGGYQCTRGKQLWAVLRE